MSFDDSDDYELLPHKELESLRKEIIQIKNNPYGETEKGKTLLDSMDRLNESINKLITILEDAQKDIIEEYQESKPAEKLNKVLEQNETIARALISINDNMQATQMQTIPEKDQATETLLPPALPPQPAQLAMPTFQPFEHDQQKDFVDVQSLNAQQNQPITQASVQNQMNMNTMNMSVPFQPIPNFPPIANQISSSQMPPMNLPPLNNPSNFSNHVSQPMNQQSRSLPPFDLSGLPPLPPSHKKKILGLI